MHKSVAFKYILPFVQWFGLMVVIAIFIDYILHRLDLLSIGYWLSYPGTILIILSFIYSLRKRKIIESGSPKKLLSMHEYLAWAGSILILVHAGIHFNAILPWLGIICRPATMMNRLQVNTGLIKPLRTYYSLTTLVRNHGRNFYFPPGSNYGLPKRTARVLI